MSGGNLKVVVTTQAEIKSHEEDYGYVRVGSTVNPEQRAGQYEAEGYSGTMYAAPTQNMMQAEDKLLEAEPRHNEQKLSNGDEAPGFVYAIVGRKYNQ